MADQMASETYRVSLDDEPQLDSHVHFVEAGRALVDRYPGTLTVHRAVEALTWLAQCGYLVSATEHDRCRGWYAARLAHAEQAADELVRRLDDQASKG